MGILNNLFIMYSNDAMSEYVGKGVSILVNQSVHVCRVRVKNLARSSERDSVCDSVRKSVSDSKFNVSH